MNQLLKKYFQKEGRKDLERIKRWLLLHPHSGRRSKKRQKKESSIRLKKSQKKIWFEREKIVIFALRKRADFEIRKSEKRREKFFFKKLVKSKRIATFAPALISSLRF